MPASFLRAIASPFIVLLLPLLHVPPAGAAVVFSAAGTSPAGSAVSFTAGFEFAGDVLTVTLENTSPEPTRFTADVLGSLYFDIVRAGARPPLVYRSAFGQVVRVRAKADDEPVVYTPPAKAGGDGTVTPGLGPSDLVATKKNDFTWQFRSLDPRLPPLVGFGIGTVGNSALSPNNFQAQIVDQADFTLVTDGELEPLGNLADRLVVRERATFTFSGAEGWGEKDLAGPVTFGLGTTPDGTLVAHVPEPVVPAALGLAGWLAWLVRRRRGGVGSRNYACRVPPPR